PQCAPVDVPLKVSRDIAMSQDVSLSIRRADGSGEVGLPDGVNVQILDSPIVEPGGNLVAQRTLRFTVEPRAQRPPDGLTLTVVGKAGSDPGGPSRTLWLNLFRQSPDARFASSRVVHTPRFQQSGSTVRVTGDGFCAGTRVQVGADPEEVPARLI